jgi:hypothetical protein
VTRSSRAGLGLVCVVLLTAACHSSAPSTDVVAPVLTAPAPLAPARSDAPPPPTATPASPAMLLERVHELATKLGTGLANEDVEKRLDVRLTADDSAFSGSSQTWPAKVFYVPAAGQQGASLHLSFNDLGSVKIGDLDKRFGPADHHIDAKEGLATYQATPDTRLLVKYLGGWASSTPVSAIRLESARAREPHLPDLF